MIFAAREKHESHFGAQARAIGKGAQIAITRLSRLMTSIRWRFIIIYLCVIAVAFVVVAMLSVRIVEDSLVMQRLEDSIKDASSISISIELYVNETDAKSVYNAILTDGRALSGRVLVANAEGVVMADSFSRLNGTKLELRELTEVLLGTSENAYGFHLVHSEDGGAFWTVYCVSAVISNSRTTGAVVLSQSIQDVVTKAASIRDSFMWIFIAAIFVIILMTFLLTNHITHPIKLLREAAARISRGDFSQRVHISGKNEIAELGETFNTMSERLQNADENKNEFVSNASHELKTPLTSMKILCESILYQDGVEEKVYKEFLADIDEEIDRLTVLINDLLLMTKLDESEAALQLEQTELAHLVSQSAAHLQPIAESKDIDLRWSVPKEAYCECDAGRIRQAVNNLIENAIKYTNPGGSVRVQLELLAGDAVLTVKDNGVGINEFDLPHIFDRFYRVDKARSRETGGTGLGLHIVRRIALLHNGSVRVRSAPGRGSEFILTIPVQNKER